MPTSTARSRMRVGTSQQSSVDNSGPSSLVARCPSTEGGVSGLVSQQQVNEGGKVDQRQSLKRRHGRTSPHSSPYLRQNEAHSSSSSCSSSTRHHTSGGGGKSSLTQRQRRRQQQRLGASSKSTDAEARYNSEDEYDEGDRGSNFQKDYRGVSCISTCCNIFHFRLRYKAL